MPFALLIIGGVLLVSAARGTVTQGPNGSPGLFTLLESDFTGQNNFVFWFVTILAIGAVGYIQKLRPLSVAFLTLTIIVLFLRKGTGFFAQALSAISATQSATPSISTAGSTAASANSALNLSSLLSSPALSSSVASAPNVGSSDLSSLLSSSALSSSVPSSPVSSSTTSSSTISDNFGSSLLPASSDTDLSFPSLGIG